MKKYFFLIIISLFISFIIGCTNSTESNTLSIKNAKIGDVLLSDGSKVFYKDITDKQKNKAIAIVCSVIDGHALGLGLHQSDEEIIWASLNSPGYKLLFKKNVCTPSLSNQLLSNKTTFLGDFDGSDNWSEICKIDNKAISNIKTNYPIFDWVNNYGITYNLPKNYKQGWYIPSIYELAEIARNKIVINNALETLTDSILYEKNKIKNESYWSSSQDSSHKTNVYWIHFGGAGFIHSSSKFLNMYACCVRKF